MPQGSTVWYLSGAPRLSTSPDTESVGPRNHILGMISGFESLGHDVQRFIVGDSAPAAFHGGGSEKQMSRSRATIVASDALRLAYRARSRRKLRAAAASMPTEGIAFVYERYALYQELGSVFRARGVPWVLEVNALLAEEATAQRRATSSRLLARSAESRTLRAADLVIAVSDQLAERLVGTYALDRSRVVVVPNGIDPARWSSSSPPAAGSPAAPTPLPPGTIRVGFVGSLYPWQNVEALILAATDERLRMITVDIAGAGSDLDRLVELTNRLGLSDRVRFHGRIGPESVPGFLAGMDICYAGHRVEDGIYFSPLKIWEYIASATPVVASESQDALMLQARDCGVTCFGGDDPRDALVRAIADLPDLRRSARRGREWVLDEHSWERRAELVARRAAEPTAVGR